MAHVTLRILPNQTDPHAISERLGVTPTRVVKKGELAEPGMLDSAAAESEWSLSSEAAAVAGGIGAHLSWLMEQLGEQASELAALRGDGLGVRLSLTLDRGRTLTLRQELLQQLVATGLDVELRFG